MPNLTIRNLDIPLKSSLRLRAARRGHSMEQEVRDILKSTLAEPEPSQLHFMERFRQRFAALGGVELDLPPREKHREPPDFGK